MMRGSLATALIALVLVAAGILAPSPALAAEEHCRDLHGGSAVLDWGINGAEQLAAGFGSGYENAPQPVAGVSGATQVKAGYRWALALLGDCTLRSWGGNGYGQLGNGNQALQMHPVRVQGLSEVKEIAVGNGHAMALLFNGTVWTWGASEFGERGNKEKGWERNARQNESWFVARDRPTQVPGLSGVAQIAAAGTRDYALLSNGTVEAWGEDHNGLLGVEETPAEEELCYGETHAVTPAQCSTVPRLVKVAGVGTVTGVERIAAGEEDGYAIRAGGSEVIAWGAGTKGQLGDGATLNSPSPVRVSIEPPSPVRDVAAGGQQVLARLADGEVYAWGNDGAGQLGFEAGSEPTETCGHGHPCSTLPMPVLGLEHVVSVSAGEATSFALREEEGGAHVVYSFGSNGAYELLGLGNSLLLETSTPTPIAGLGQVSQVAASTSTAVMLLQSGQSRAPAISLSASTESLTLSWSLASESYRVRYRPVGTREFSKPVEGSCKTACSLTINGLRPQPYEVSLRTPTEGREGKEKPRKAIGVPKPGKGWPVNTAPPTASGSPATETGRLRQGQTLKASPGSWSESPEFTYEWLRCLGNGEAGVDEEVGTECEVVGSAQTYVVGQADVARSLVVRVEAKNASGSSAATSEPEIILASSEESEPPYPTPTAAPTITGIAVEGHTLNASAGSWENAPTHQEDRWYRCKGATKEGTGASCSAIIHKNGMGENEPVTGATYVPGAEDVEDFVEVQERAENPGGYEILTSQAVQIAPQAVPTNTTPPSISGTIEQGQVLSVLAGVWTHAPINPHWQWLRCEAGGGGCGAITGATGSSYTIGSNDVGHSLEASETTENGVGRSEPAFSAASEIVPVPPSAPPGASAPPTVSGTAEQGHTLTAHAASWNGEPKSFARQWKRCEPPANSNCRAIAGATSATYVPTSADVGKTLLLRETATNAAGSGVAQSSSTAAVLGAVPAASVPPAIRGSAQQGREMSERHGNWSNEPTSYAYRWLRCESSGEHCEEIGVSSRTYAPVAADVGRRLSVEETARNETGAGTGSTSTASAVVLPPPPASTSPPTITGTGAENETLSADEGSWSGSPTTRADQWLRCEQAECAPIEGATKSSYTLSAADVGFSVAVRESAHNSGGWEAAVSEALAVGGAPVPFVTAASPTSGPTAGGTVVTITGGNLQEAQGVDFGFAAASSFEIISPSRIRAVAPAASAGTVDITVTTPEGTSAVSSAARFSYGVPPSVSGIEPVEGPEAGGTAVTIRGANLSEALAVKFGGSDARSFGVQSASAITAVAPAGTGKVGVKVITPYGSTTPGAGEQFTYVHTGNPPVVAVLSLKKGPAVGGTTLTISGHYFTSTTRVTFGSVAGPASFTVNSDTSITTTSPPGASGTIDVLVTNEFGTSAVTSKDHFKYENPTVTSVSPPAGPRPGGTIVTVKGSGFVPGEGKTIFKFTKPEATFVECASTSECTMIAPAALKSNVVDVRAKANGHTSERVPPDKYTYE